jgi:hypothetical protein
MPRQPQLFDEPIAREIIDTPVTEEQIREAIRQVIAKDPNPEEINQVAGRLASVGWPLENGHR